MSDYTPTTEEMRAFYTAERLDGPHLAGFPVPSVDEAEAEFDRWLAAHDAEVRASVRVQHAWRPDTGPDWVAFCGDPAAMPLDPTPETLEELNAIPLCTLCHKLAMRFARQEVRAAVLAEQGEAEWEYGISYAPGNEEFEGEDLPTIQRRVKYIRRQGGYYSRTVRSLRRRPAGEPEPVEENGESNG